MLRASRYQEDWSDQGSRRRHHREPGKSKGGKEQSCSSFQGGGIDIRYGRGISKSGEIVDLGVELNIIQKSGSWLPTMETNLVKARDARETMIEDNPELPTNSKRNQGKIATGAVETKKEKGNKQ